jgi:hypothetical protein
MASIKTNLYFEDNDLESAEIQTKTGSLLTIQHTEESNGAAPEVVLRVNNNENVILTVEYYHTLLKILDQFFTVD